MSRELQLCPQGWGEEKLFAAVTEIPIRKQVKGVEIPTVNHSGTTKAWRAIEQALHLYVFGDNSQRRWVQEALDRVFLHGVAGTELRSSASCGLVHWSTMVVAAKYGAQLGVDVFEQFDIPGKLQVALDGLWPGLGENVPPNPSARNQCMIASAIGDLAGCHLFVMDAKRQVGIRARRDMEGLLSGTPFKTKQDPMRRFEHYVAVLDGTSRDSYYIQLRANVRLAARLFAADSRSTKVRIPAAPRNGSAETDLSRMWELYRHFRGYLQFSAFLNQSSEEGQG